MNIFRQLANSAALAGEPYAYLVWGIADGDHAVVGTTFRPHTLKKGNAGLKIWLFGLLCPKIDFTFHEVAVDGHTVVLLEIEKARDRPVGFKGEAYIRVGSSKKKLKNCVGKERALWRAFDGNPSKNKEAERRRAEQWAERNNVIVEACLECDADAYSPTVGTDYKFPWKCG